MNHAQVLQQYLAEHPEHDLECNYELLLSESAKPVSLSNIRVAARRLGNRLALSPSYVEAFREFYSRHPELDLEANTNFLTELHHGDEVTIESLEELLQFSRDKLAVTAAYNQQQSEQAERENLFKELGRGFESFGLQDLRHFAAVKRENDRRKGLSSAELRALARQENPAPTAPALPARYTREAINALGATELKRILHLYGANAVNERKGYEAPKQPGQSVRVKI